MKLQLITSKFLVAGMLLTGLILYLACGNPSDITESKPIPDFTIRPGPPRQVNQEITLDGSVSKHSAGGAIEKWWWDCSPGQRPNGSHAGLKWTTGSKNYITPDLPGEYHITLTVEDNFFEQASVTKSFWVSDIYADAGPDQNVDVDDTVLLDGSGSSNPQGIEYQWSIVSKPARSLLISSSIVNRTSVQASLTIDEPGAYAVKLDIAVGASESSDTMQIITNPPVINGFDPDSGLAGTIVTITGRNFSNNLLGNTVYFDGNSAMLLTTTSDTLRVVVPAGATTGPITVTLAETGETAQSAEDFVVLSPVSIAGRDTALNFPVNDYVLDGSASYDPLGRQLEYIWSAALFPTNSSPVLSQNYADPYGTFYAGEPGRYEIELRVYVAANPDEMDRDTLVITSLPPEITYFHPDSGMVGDSIDIQGLNLSLHEQGNEVYFNGVQAQVVGSNPTSNGFIWEVPAGVTTGPIRITVLETGESYTTPTDFKVIPGRGGD